MRNTLLLGRGGRILNVINWQHAVTLLYFRNEGSTVFPLDFHEDEVHSTNRAFKLPSVLLLTDRKDKYCGFDKLPMTRANIFLRDDYECQYCGRKLGTTSGTIDHVYPQAHGGTNTWRNVVACCRRCNNEKGEMSASDYAKMTGRKLKRKPYTPQRNVLFKSYLEKDEYACWEPYLKEKGA